jgi:hypothetical protein
MKRRHDRLIWIGFVLSTIVCGFPVCSLRAGDGRTFYVSSSTGHVKAAGTSEATAWQGLDQVNAADLGPGDTVLFRRGDSWRDQLRPKNGSPGKPVTYGAYGAGARPLLLGSVSRDRPGDWHDEGGHIWATAPAVGTELPPLGAFASHPWAVYTEGGARVRTTMNLAKTRGTIPSLTLLCEANGSAGHHIQLFNSGLSIRANELYLFTFRARSTKPFTLKQVVLMKQSPPWPAYAGQTDLAAIIGPNWTTYRVRFHSTRTADDGRLTITLGGALPAGASFDFEPLSWQRCQPSSANELGIDVGNIIFDGGQSVGVKKWKREDLEQPGDYWYSGADWQVRLYSKQNPAEIHGSIELALRRHIVDQSNARHVVYDGLALACGAAHGFGGGTTQHLVIRDCDVSWIGGGHQLTQPNGNPVRFGNGIEFWENAHDILVEGCRIWEIYDAALTNQGSRENSQINITYRDNVIWNSEYSFEFWNRGPESQTRNIRFEHNTCYGAGLGWGHAQRPDPNGHHLMFYVNTAQTSGIVVHDNIFAVATDSCLRMDNDWSKNLVSDGNCWFQPEGTLISMMRRSFPATRFAEYQKWSGLDAHSVVGDPRFVNPAEHDFRLGPGSSATVRGESSNPAGSRKRLETS